ncbi:MAG: 4-hydroxy-3-methylbut-2-enyl diphosphate reductase, partial [Gemmiger sp.]
MQILLAKTAGFCFGVNRAVKLTYDLLSQGHRIATLGPLIHNPQVVSDLEHRGALTCDTVDEVPDGYEVIIRSHGVPQAVYDKISTRSLAYHDATCPFVAKIHKIAVEAGRNGAFLLVAGDRKHPEVQGIVGHTTGEVRTFANISELEELLPLLKQQKSIYVVAQTTFHVQSWETCKEFLKKQCTNSKIFDTICNATWARQQEAEDLSQKCD